jgi:type IV secretion system protein VirD4
MTANRAALVLAPVVLMILVTIFMVGDRALAFDLRENRDRAPCAGARRDHLPLCRGGGRRHSLPVRLRRLADIKFAGGGVIAGNVATIMIAACARRSALLAISGQVHAGRSTLSY